MANAQELIRIARAAIGDGGTEDWQIIPSEHARWFERAAPTLSDNLRRARPEGLAKMFEDADREAVRASGIFKRTVRRADTAVFIAGSLGALLVVAIGLKDRMGDASSIVIGVIGVMGALASSLAAMWIGKARDGELAQRWGNERANAEAKRLAFFKDVMAGATPNPLDRLLALEYTRRFLLDNQVAYLRQRGREHERASQRALDRSTAATFISSMLTAAGGLLAFVEPEYGVVAGLAAVASFLGTLFISRSEMNLDRKNADRYRVAADALAERRLDLDTFRTRVATGELTAVEDFFQPVFMALKADHQAFLTDAQQQDLAIGEMQGRLDTARDAMSGNSMTGGPMAGGPIASSPIAGKGQEFPEP